MFFKNKNKGAVSLFTGIAVLFVSIIFLGIFTYFAMGYFGGLEDSQRMKNNRNSLSLINEMLLEIKDSGSESYRAITLNTSDPITIDHNSSKITLTQEIKNQRSIERLKTETNIGALTINKRETSIVYTLDYNGQLLFYNTMDIMPVKQKIIFEKINEVNGIPVISISTEQLSFEGTKIYSPIENITYSLGEAIEFKGIVTNTLEDYNCEWVSDIDGVLTEQCNYVVEEISQGEHEITFTAKIEEEVIATKKINIIVGSITVVPLFSINILTPSNNYSLDQGEEISFTSQVNNPVGSYSCAWSSSIDGSLSSDCNFSSTGLSVGSHTITLAVTDENETKTKNISLIVNQSIFTNVAILSPSQSSTHDFGETISFSSEVNNPEGSYNCSWTSSIDGNLIPSKVPYAQWDFNESSGTTVYDVRNNINGTMNNVTRTTDRFGRANNALSFNGTTSYVNLGSSNLITGDNLQKITVSLWAKTTSTAAQYPIAIKRSATESSLFSVSFNQNTSGGTSPGSAGFLTRDYADVGHNWFTNNNNYNDGEWYHIVGTVDDLNRSLYINGEYISSDNQGMQNVSGNTANAIIGSFNTSTHMFNGQIDDIRIYRDSITSSDVLKLYKNNYSLNNCDINVSNLSPGSHTITLAVTDSNQTLTTTRNITVVNPTTIAILSPSQSSTHDFGETISFSSEVNNPEGNYSCSWTSSIDGNLTTNNNPIGRWDFNETSGTTAYDLIGEVNGTMNNVTRTTDRFGRADNALSFNGSTSYVNLGNTLNSQLNYFTLSAWINPVSVSNTRIIDTRGTGTGGLYKGFQFKAYQNGSNWSFHNSAIDDGAGNYIPCTSCGSENPLNQWYHVIMTRDSQNIKFYLNGELDGTVNTSSVGNIVNTLPLVIGSGISANGVEGTISQQFNGKIDDVLIFDQAIDQEDVLKLYKNNYSSNNCDFNTSTLSVGEHTITLSVTNSNQTLTTTRNITVENIYLEATGGTITTSGDYKYHTFTSSGTFNVTTLGDGKVDVLVVGGGGGAGKAGTNTLRNPGGGGAGGLIYIEDYTISSTGNKSITVGSGGTGATTQAATGNNGQNSVFENLTAYGGGGGGSRDDPYRAGTSGGSGGGANLYSAVPANGGSATQPSTNDGYSNSGFGNPGATSIVNVGAGGGGGAGGPGTVTSGGSGMSIWGNIYAKGGDAHSDASSGAANTGNGGNGSAVNLATNGGNGGSGIVIVRYKYQN